MELKDFLEAIQYRITDGDPYCWNSFGPNARWINSDELDRYGASVVHDTKTQTIYCAEVHDYVNERSYRWFNPDYADAVREESRQRNVDFDQAWDHVKFTNLDVVKDFLEKCRRIVNNEPYDTRVSIPIDLEDFEIFELMKMAHERDITLNQLVEHILNEVIKRESVAV